MEIQRTALAASPVRIQIEVYPQMVTKPWRQMTLSNKMGDGRWEKNGERGGREWRGREEREKLCLYFGSLTIKFILDRFYHRGEQGQRQSEGRPWGSHFLFQDT